ncbi:hypothetical protein EYV94_20820 [Puteibacter caeruleilacunae]|nr:hypothetical protein EYV94_20820 [Puteibacter caeruleilacunae]
MLVMNLTQEQIIVGAAVVGIVLILLYIPFRLWFIALMSGIKIPVLELLLMKFRRSPVEEIVRGLIASAKSGIIMRRDELEAHALAGGRVSNVVNGMIAAKKAGLKLSFRNATKADFQGMDIAKTIRLKQAKDDCEIRFE